MLRGAHVADNHQITGFRRICSAYNDRFLRDRKDVSSRNNPMPALPPD
jgi:hypothetical protein